MLEDLIRGLQRLDADFDAVALADALWLCGLMPTGESTGPAQAPTEQLAKPGAATDDGTISTEGTQEDDSADSPEENDVFDSPGGPGSRPAVAGSTGRGPALPDDLALARALRPLKRRYPHGRDLVLDTEATVRAYAETQDLVPVLSPRPERWFHLDLVVDQSASMQVWQDVAGELLTLLQQLGAFRTVRRWQLDAQSDDPLLFDASGVPVRPHRLRDPHGRRLVAVFSDCVDAGWHAPQIWQTLRSWAQSTATVLLNPLPPRLWPHTGLDGPVVSLAPAGPGARAADMGFTIPVALRMLSAMTASGVGNWMPCPVAGISATSLAAWARSMMATGMGGCQGVLIPPCGRLTEADDDAYDAFESDGLGLGPDALAQAPPSAHQLVHAFRHLASPSASRLAVLCSHQTEFSLPILRAVQEAMEPDSGVAELAELVVSGLFEHAPGSETGDLRLRFRAGVREELHKSLAAEDDWQVRLALRRFLERETPREPHPITIAAENGGTRVPDGLAPFTTTSQATPRPQETTPQETPTRPTVVILTTLALEYQAVRAHLTDIEELVHHTGTRVERGELNGTPWSVALAEIGEGTLNTAAITERIYTWLGPQALFFVGVAGGLKDDVKVGDVVVATKVYGIHGGKETPEGFLVRPEVWYSSHRLEQAARHALRGKAHFKPIAIGDVVLADAESAIASHLHTHYNDAVAIEMEGAGVAQAAHLNGTLDALIIRGISDKAEAHKRERDAEGSQPEAAKNAAAASIAVLRELEPLGGDHIDFRGGVFHGPVVGKMVHADVPLPHEDGFPSTAPARAGSPSPHTAEPKPQGTLPGAPPTARIVMLARTTDPVLAGSRLHHVSTGLLLSPRLILTAAHVLQRADTRAIKVRSVRGRVTAGSWHDCHVLWHDSTHDAALLLAKEDVTDPTTEANFPPLRWGEIISTGPLEGCDVISVSLSRASSSLSDGHHLKGILHPSRHHQGSYEFESSSQPPLGQEQPREGGMPGAPLLFGGLLVGVTNTTSHVRPGNLRLKVTPISTLVRDPEFARIISAHLHDMPRLQPLSPTTAPAQRTTSDEPGDTSRRDSVQDSTSESPEAAALPTLAQLTTAEQRWRDREEDITAVGGDPYEVGRVFARRWIERLASPDRLQQLISQYPRIPHQIDSELLRYAARFGLLAHKDDQIDEHDRYAIRAGFWREVDTWPATADAGEAQTTKNELARVRVGITGHHQIPATVLPTVRQGVVEGLSADTNVEALSCLAPGTDQLFAEIALDRGIDVTAVVPGTDYEAQLDDKETRATYRRLRASCTEVIDLPIEPTREDAFYAAGRWIVDHADHLIAAWDGQPARGLDRTADVVAYARQIGVPVTVLWDPGVTRAD